jgi:hypothetical protein
MCAERPAGSPGAVREAINRVNVSLSSPGEKVGFFCLVSLDGVAAQP